MMKKIIFNIAFLLFLINNIYVGKTYIVAESGGDFAKIQSALNIAVAGDTILVREKSTPYFEELSFKSNGNETDGYIVLSAYQNEHPIIDGTNFKGGNNWPQGLIKIINKNYIKVIGFEIRNLITSDANWFPAGIWIRGNSHHIQILNNKIHHIEHNNADGGAHGIAVYGTNSSNSINNILIEGNEIYNCKLAWSESLVLNGNVENFVVQKNIVHDNNNIAFDFIGHEGECAKPEFDQVRNGIVVDNIAYDIDSRTNPSYQGEGSADGFYVDGGKDIVFERNTAYNCNIGFEVASEHGGKSTSGIIIRNSFIKNNISLGLAIGGYDAQRGSADNCYIVNNTFYKNNNEDNSWGAEILINYYCNDILITNNIVYAESGTASMENVTNTGSNKVLKNNLYYCEGNTKWLWKNNSLTNFEDYKNASGQEANSIFANPLLVNPSDNDPHLLENSPVIDKGQVLEASIIGEFDFFGSKRVVNNVPDIGAVEFNGTASSVENNLHENSFELYQNYPNPFNPATTIKFNIKETSFVELKIFDVLGQEIVTLINQKEEAKIHQIIYNASSLESGVYFYRLKVGGNIKYRKMCLIR